MQWAREPPRRRLGHALGLCTHGRQSGGVACRRAGTCAQVGSDSDRSAPRLEPRAAGLGNAANERRNRLANRRADSRWRPFLLSPGASHRRAAEGCEPTAKPRREARGRLAMDPVPSVAWGVAPQGGRTRRAHGAAALRSAGSMRDGDRFSCRLGCHTAGRANAANPRREALGRPAMTPTSGVRARSSSRRPATSCIRPCHARQEAIAAIGYRSP